MKITFDDLPLLEAIRQLFDDPTYVRSELALITDSGREEILQRVISLLDHSLVGKYRFEHILLCVNQFRKLGKKSREKRLIVLDHAKKMKEPHCFYQGKVATPCSDEIDLDRVKPGKREGEYTLENTVLSCSKHNRSKGCKAVEEFWKQ